MGPSGGEHKLFFSLAVLLLLYCCNFVRHCVCRHVTCFIELLIGAHIVTWGMYIDFLVQGLLMVSDFEQTLK